jgi:hypothetical protein
MSSAGRSDTSPIPWTIVCDVAALRAQAVAVDALARMQLDAKRAGGEILLRNASDGLLALINIVGLAGVLRVEPSEQIAEREQPDGAQEEGEFRNPAG